MQTVAAFLRWQLCLVDSRGALSCNLTEVVYFQNRKFKFGIKSLFKNIFFFCRLYSNSKDDLKKKLIYCLGQLFARLFKYKFIFVFCFVLTEKRQKEFPNRQFNIRFLNDAILQWK